jgi:Fe-S-cluster containining protein
MSDAMTNAKRLRLAHGLRKMIPGGFPCIAGCTSCCKGPLQLLRVEADELLLHPATEGWDPETKKVFVEESDEPGDVAVRIVDERGWCPFLGEAGCTVYADRPTTCRVYAQSAIMRCREKVKCPPEAEVAVDVLLKWRKLAGKSDFESVPAEAREDVLWALDEWRRRNPGKEDTAVDAALLKEVGPIFRERLLGRK